MAPEQFSRLKEYVSRIFVGNWHVFDVFSQLPGETLVPNNSTFTSLVTTPGTIGVDKTNFIEAIDKEGRYQYMFLRPRRWGKSTFLRMLAAYYDKTKTDEFMDIFGRLYIGRNPTRYRNTLLVMVFDLSSISPISPELMRVDYHRVINSTLQRFLQDNARFLGNPDPRILIQEDSTRSLTDILVSAPQ
jgi:hypothetical protein